MYFSVIIVKKLGIWVGIYDCMLWINQLFFLKNITEQTSSGIFFFKQKKNLENSYTFKSYRAPKNFGPWKILEPYLPRKVVENHRKFVCEQIPLLTWNFKKSLNKPKPKNPPFLLESFSLKIW